MKNLIIHFAAFPIFSFSQDINSALNLSGGAEYHDAKKHAWNVELSYQDRIARSKRFWSEFGINYSVLEYKGDSNDKLDTLNLGPQLALGAIYGPGYSRSQKAHYSRSTSLRFQVGANFTILDKKKLNLSIGTNIVSQFLLNHQEHGQNVYVPIYDTLYFIDVHYSIEERSLAMDVHIQPHLDVSYLLSNNFWINARVSCYDKLFKRQKFLPTQVNLGLRYYL